jgi:hypothetical protein
VLQVYSRTKIHEIRVIPTPIVALKGGELLQVIGDVVKLGTLDTADRAVGYEDSIVNFVDRIPANFAREFSMIGRCWQLA